MVTPVQIAGFEATPIIGLEIHVHLATQTKMFCGCALLYGAPPNSATCPVCLGLPGALPVPNRSAVELAVRASLALNCRINEVTKWDRKSYFYPDLPKNYQISQYDQPIAEHGFLEFPFGDGISKVRIRRAHLEEDAGKNVHDIPGVTAIDLNRAGAPLLEIVTEPDLHSADEAREFAVQLQRIMRYLAVSDADMQKGQMRFEPNINLKLTRDDRDYRTPIVEVKNLNSFKSLHGAIAFEIPRQAEQFGEDGVEAASGNKRNRGWDDVREVTAPQREKEEAHDYRYFPDPDLPHVRLEPAWVASVAAEMPELPITRTERFISEYKLPSKDAPALVDDRATADLLDSAADAGGDKLILAKHFVSHWARLANEHATTIGALGIGAVRMAELANLQRDGAINATAAGQIADAMVAQHESPAKLAEVLGLMQLRDTGQIEGWVADAFAANTKAVGDAATNPKKLKAARGFLIGAVMKASGGAADPKLVGELIDARLESLRQAGD